MALVGLSALYVSLVRAGHRAYATGPLLDIVPTGLLAQFALRRSTRGPRAIWPGFATACSVAAVSFESAVGLPPLRSGRLQRMAESCWSSYGMGVFAIAESLPASGSFPHWDQAAPNVLGVVVTLVPEVLFELVVGVAACAPGKARLPSGHRPTDAGMIRGRVIPIPRDRSTDDGLP
jgi:hypothetical protein